jgi:hypothetical protein
VADASRVYPPARGGGQGGLGLYRRSGRRSGQCGRQRPPARAVLGGSTFGRPPSTLGQQAHVGWGYGRVGVDRGICEHAALRGGYPPRSALPRRGLGERSPASGRPVPPGPEGLPQGAASRSLPFWLPGYLLLRRLAGPMTKRAFEFPAVSLSVSRSSELIFRERRTIAFRFFAEFMSNSAYAASFEFIGASKEPVFPCPGSTSELPAAHRGLLPEG